VPRAIIVAMPDLPASQRLRLGELLFDPSSGELTTAAGVTRLPPQVAAVLRMLAEHPGQVVPRAALRDRLWPDTTVEFDQGLNFCIRQLRTALDDDANQPRYIETLPRRGYRLIAPVSADAEPPAATQSRQPETPPGVGAARRQRSVPRVAALVAAIVTALVAGVWAFARSGEERIALAIMPFDVQTTDSAVLDYRARLAEELVARVTQAEGERAGVMGPTSTAGFQGTRTPLDTLARRLGATHVLSGGVRTSPEGMQIFAQLIRVRDGRHLYGRRLVDTTFRGVPAPGIAPPVAAAIANAAIAALPKPKG
jgi:DNA-binding winged helix-turn-helix (wHTH) protein/TolB-like protein